VASSFNKTDCSSTKFVHPKFCLREMHRSKKRFSLKELSSIDRLRVERRGATGGELDEPIDPSWPRPGGEEVGGGGGVSQVLPPPLSNPF